MNKVWLITGATRGLGFEIAKAALNAGDRVVATGRNLVALQEAYKDFGERVLLQVLDVSNSDQADTATKRVLEQFGRIDVLVNNAGYGQLGAFEEIDDTEIRQQFETNVFGPFNVTRAVLPVMREQRSGRIFNLSSIGGALGFKAASIYCASKFAVEGFSESLGLEVAPFGIHVSLIEPGFFRTDFLDDRSVRYGATSIEDYNLGGPTRSTYEVYNHKQPGDPAKLGLALVQLAQVENPPVRFAVGSDAVEFIGSANAARTQELLQWQTLSRSTDGNFAD